MERLSGRVLQAHSIAAIMPGAVERKRCRRFGVLEQPMDEGCPAAALEAIGPMVHP